MKRTSMQRFGWTALVALGLVACGPVTPDDNTNGNANQNQINNQNLNQNNLPGDASIEGLVRVQGVVWSPGADLAGIREENRFPIPGVVVAMYTYQPETPDPQTNCNCLEIPDNVASTTSDKVTGEFELRVLPDRTYWLVIQKGDFRRVRQVAIPDMPNEIFRIETGPDVARPPEVTLPNRPDLATGDTIPRIAIADGAYEDQSLLFESMGFNYDQDITLLTTSFTTDQVKQLLENPTELATYSLLIAPCGASMPSTSAAKDNLRNWIKTGGKLYVDDFSYDFVEQIFPEFLSWWVENPGSGSGSEGPCGEGSDPGYSCNNWSSYGFDGDPGDADFEAWLALPDVNRGDPIRLEGAWDYLYTISQGVVGWDEDFNAEIRQEPKVWMYNANTVPYGASHVPATVGWPYYCGKVLYTVYHTHGTSSENPMQYRLMLQEKIMMYLILDINTCSTGPIVR
jgi:hypothetical protein